jgi:hypothetical protein
LRYLLIKTIRNLTIFSVFITSLFPIYALSGGADQVPESHVKETETHYKYVDPISMEDSGLKIHFNPKGIYYSETFKSPFQPKGDELAKLYQKYKNKYLGLGLKAKGIISVLFYNKINLNKIEEFKKIGIDIYELDKRKFVSMNDKEKILLSKICITGTVIDSMSVTDPEKSNYLTLYKIQVDKMFKGNEYYNKVPDIINFYSVVGNVMRPRARHIDRIGYKVTMGLSHRFTTDFELDNVSFNSNFFLESEGFMDKFEKINDSKNFYNEVSKYE